MIKSWIEEDLKWKLQGEADLMSLHLEVIVGLQGLRVNIGTQPDIEDEAHLLSIRADQGLDNNSI